MGDTTIEWTEKTWNPTRGCSIESPGCNNCYAMGIAARFSGPGQPFEGYAKFSGKRRLAQWTGKLGLVPEMLPRPLTWRAPSHVFVNSMSDLFHERVSDTEIAAVFGVMSLACHHTYQVLTKRAHRMREVVSRLSLEACFDAAMSLGVAFDAARATGPIMRALPEDSPFLREGAPLWPLPNVWLGVSVENQEYADARIPELLATPAAVRFVSYEPALGPVDFARWLPTVDRAHFVPFSPEARAAYGEEGPRMLRRTPVGGAPDWIIVGGESGRGARPFDVRWAESVVRQCRGAGVACFVKQLGAKPYMSPEHDMGTGYELALRSPKGGDPDEWPASVRVRRFPQSTTRGESE